MSMTAKARTVAVGAAALAVTAMAGYVLAFRPWHLRWGATDEEAARAMPGDDLVPEPTYVTNRAITIAAAPSEVWPWLAQMGEYPRAGFYSYAWPEQLQGMHIANARRLLPGFQTLHVGQALDRGGNMLVKSVDPGRSLVLGPPESAPFHSSWTLTLYPASEHSTRLVARVRARIKPCVAGLFWALLLDPGHFVMERKMLLEIKQLAESRGSSGRIPS
jgi:hypothetical protein